MRVIDPQTLIDLPGAGNAEKELRKAGLWKKSALDWLNSIPDDDCLPRVNKKIDAAFFLLETMEDDT